MLDEHVKYSTPGERNATLRQLVDRLRASGQAIIRSRDLTRRDRELLMREGLLRQMVKGWYLFSLEPLQSDAVVLRTFVYGYCRARFGDAWHLSPELSVLVHAGMPLPNRIIVHSPLAKNGTLSIAGFGSLVDVQSVDMPPIDEPSAVGGAQVLPLPVALIRCSEDFWRENQSTITALVRTSADMDQVLNNRHYGGRHRAGLRRLIDLLWALGRESEVVRICEQGAARIDGHRSLGLLAEPREDKTTIGALEVNDCHGYGERLRKLLDAVAVGECSTHDAYARLKGLPFEDIGDALLDHHRQIRQGQPEVVYGEGKTAQQIVYIMQRLAQHGTPQLVTRVDADKAAVICARLPDVLYHETARCLQRGQVPSDERKGTITVVTAGTSDAMVAHESVITARFLGNRVNLLNDVGVAGLHRLLHHLEVLQQSSVLIVVAGMEGALPSVVAGLVDVPVIAVPTSVGYGAAFEGITPLLGMMTSCAAGVTVVNIDNGFGAAAAADRMNR